MTSFRVLVTARSFAKTPGAHHDWLAAHGCHVDLRAAEQPLNSAALAALLPGYDGVILGLDHCDAAALAQADRLRVISRYGVGVENVDLAAAAARGIIVTNTPNTNNISVAELAIGLLFALARQIARMAAGAQQGDFTRYTGIELTGKTLGVAGFGAIGREVARRALGLGMHVIAYDPYYQGDWGAVEPVDLPALWARLWALSLHLPLTPTTTHLVNADTLKQMQSGSFLINTARGGLVDEAALYDALRLGNLAGAAMDVFATEPPTDSPLLTLPTFIATPHAGGATREAIARMALLAAENLVAVLNGVECPDTVRV
ncbi:MAG: phosphoglycerate dehydrogenase [Chloroflexota bacterium]|nr:phosphoglycerate dehydrogenase [Chloroflexota bacterium]